jgi:predicted RNA-binding Zn-ribbon protein involved in translation (DUF1610 family)
VTSPVETISVACPKCGTVYDDWARGSINLGLEGWNPDDPEVREYLRQCETATCPSCGNVVESDTLVIEGDVWMSERRAR